MANCMKCGEFTFSALANECNNCKKKRLEKESQRRILTMEEMYDEIVSAVRNGEVRYIYDAVYVEVDSILMKEFGVFDIRALATMGWLGWKIEAVVPRTLGIALENENLQTKLNTFGGGVGGHILGVHVLISLELRQDNLEKLDAELRNNLRDFCS